MMRRNRSNFTPMNERLRGTHVAKQHEFYSYAARRAYETTLLASGITATIYSCLKTGKRCTCQSASSLSLLNEDGIMHNSTIDKVIQNVYTPNERVTFDSADMDYDNESNTGFGQDSPGEAIDLEIYGSFTQARCGNCFGSGYVGGYDLANGYRTCYDTAYATDFHHNTSERPNVFEGGTFATFETLIPDVPNTVPMIRLWNKDELLEHDSFTYTTPILGQPGTFTIHTDETFTHVELQLTPIQRVPIDFPQIADLLSVNFTNDKLTTTINVSASVGLTPYSIIREDKFNRCWHVTDIEPHYDNHKTLVFLTATCRLVGLQELYYLLMV